VPEVRVLKEDGTQLGVMPTVKALGLAQEMSLDLVEVAPLARPPVCKIISYSKYKYIESKKEQQSKKSAKEIETKEVRIRPFISEGDFQTRLRRIHEFLSSGDRVRVVVKFHGREVARPEFGHAVIDKITKYINDESLGKIDKPAKMEGKQLVAAYSPLK
jgi:translation initiation factor IF-3